MSLISTSLLAVVLAGAPLLGAAADTKPKPSPPPGPTLEEKSLRAFKARSIGPALMGGRVSDIAFDPENPWTFYVGLATGGLMKTSDNGASFEGVFEKEDVASIGAVAVAPSDAKVVWVGTGEANDRNSSAWGKGVYRSTDGGATWANVGLKDSKAIARILVHPKDPATAFVAVMGDLWGPSSERGLYKTTDSGKTWKAVLVAPSPYGNRVGCGDVALDPSDPNVLYATLYARRRTPWSFTAGPDATDGKDLGGIFRTKDGGATWNKLGTGLPLATGRIGLDVFRKNPKIVYAVVQSFDG
ncbi:MAG TPA: glycosyl hydrolase, partial [Vicinamibacteria bacterium]|nr:glycosyl hydrolase [Vicinamibacteria bacterium]